MKNDTSPEVIKIIPKSDYRLLVLFENGEERSFDMMPLLDKPIFQPLRNKGRFKCVKPIPGGIEWSGGKQDLSKDTLYLEGKPIVRKSIQKNNRIGKSIN